MTKLMQAVTFSAAVPVDASASAASAAVAGVPSLTQVERADPAAENGLKFRNKSVRGVHGSSVGSRATIIAKRVIVSIAFPLIVLALWEWASHTGDVSVVVLPQPESVIANFLSQLSSGQLVSDIASSMVSVITGFVVGAVFGIVLGAVAGLFPSFYRFFGIIFDGVRQVPGIAWFPFIILWFGIGDLSKVVMVALGTFFPVLINTVDGVRSTDPAYRDLVRLYRVKPFDVFSKIYLPSALPFLLSGLKLGASRAWMSVVAAEMLGATSGLGFRIASSQQLMQSDVMVVDVLVIGVLGWLLNVGLNAATAHAAAWKTE